MSGPGFANSLGKPVVETVPAGGTGIATGTTAYAPVCTGTTATGNFQVASTGLGTSGWVLTSNGSAALPSFQAPAAGGISQAKATMISFIFGR